jgi:hypothetical protein
MVHVPFNPIAILSFIFVPMKKSLFFLLILATSCQTETTKEVIKESEETQVEETLESMVNRHVEVKLGIPSTEKYTLKIYRENLDGDPIEDAIIAVNRENFAMDEAISKGNVAKKAEIGFMGNYNILFYYDGALNQISPPINMPSSAKAELIVNFQHIQSEFFKDILVDYKIRNSSFRDYFTVNNHTPVRVLQWKLYDKLGSDKPEAYYFGLGEGSKSLAKDILIYDGVLENADYTGDVYTFVPRISKTDKLMHRFFYNPQVGKYFTEKK